MPKTWKRLAFPSTAAISARYVATPEAKAVLYSASDPEMAFEALVERGMHDEAARFLAHALPKPEAILWGCFCARKSEGDAPPPEVAGALKAAERWVGEPSDANRYRARDAAEKAGAGTSAGCLANAAYFSGGSLSGPELPPVPPGETLTGDMVATAVLLTVIAKEPEKAPEKWAAALEKGREVARGTYTFGGLGRDGR